MNRPLPEFYREFVLELRAQRASFSTIVKCLWAHHRIARSPTALRALCFKYGVTKPPKVASPKAPRKERGSVLDLHVERVRVLRLQGYNFRETADFLAQNCGVRVTPQAVNDFCRRQCLPIHKLFFSPANPDEADPDPAETRTELGSPATGCQPSRRWKKSRPPEPSWFEPESFEVVRKRLDIARKAIITSRSQGLGLERMASLYGVAPHILKRYIRETKLPSKHKRTRSRPVHEGRLKCMAARHDEVMRLQAVGTSVRRIAILILCNDSSAARQTVADYLAEQNSFSQVVADCLADEPNPV